MHKCEALSNTNIMTLGQLPGISMVSLETSSVTVAVGKDFECRADLAKFHSYDLQPAYVMQTHVPCRRPLQLLQSSCFHIASVPCTQKNE